MPVYSAHKIFVQIITFCFKFKTKQSPKWNLIKKFNQTCRFLPYNFRCHTYSVPEFLLVISWYQADYETQTQVPWTYIHSNGPFYNIHGNSVPLKPCYMYRIPSSSKKLWQQINPELMHAIAIFHTTINSTWELC